MNFRLASSALAVIVMAGTFAVEAQADHRVRPQRAHGHFYAGQDVVRVPGFMRFVFGGYGMSAGEYAELYGEDDFDESYYDPQVDQPVRQPKPRKKTRAAAAKPAVSPAKKEISTASISKPAETVSKDVAPVTSSSAALSCGKAGEIVSGYGFTGVKSADCQGQVYAFNATRDGKSFAIKLNATSGELTEVKKLP
jgi:hypothetical protein